MASEDVEPGAPRSQSHLLVTLNVYDFVKQSDTLTASLLAFAGLGIHHSGLQIDDCEFTFNNNGIVRMPTLRMPLCRLNDSIELGKFWGSRAELDAIVDDLARSEGYRPGAYHVLRRNCNHFSEALATRLVGTSIPSWVNRSATVATMMGMSSKGVRRNLSAPTAQQLHKPRIAARAHSVPVETTSTAGRPEASKNGGIHHAGRRPRQEVDVASAPLRRAVSQPPPGGLDDPDDDAAEDDSPAEDAAASSGATRSAASGAGSKDRALPPRRSAMTTTVES
mmetsp:Transcript_19125/g.76183  ORF Transcript_19125/g.76183 Transcript_19125/m.76183 type:complete len:280 (+) Transcript_19125:186-1025(+)